MQASKYGTRPPSTLANKQERNQTRKYENKQESAKAGK